MVCRSFFLYITIYNYTLLDILYLKNHFFLSRLDTQGNTKYIFFFLKDYTYFTETFLRRHSVSQQRVPIS